MPAQSGSRFKLTVVLCCVLLAALIIGIALAVGVFQYRRSVDLLANTQFDNAQTAQTYLLAQHRSDLLRASASMAANPGFIAYMAQALSPNPVTGDIDIASIRDLLDERRSEHHLDIAAIVSPTGRVIAASGDASLDDTNLAAYPVLREARKNLTSVSGIHRDAQGVQLISFTPVRRGGNLEAWLFTGDTLDAAYIKALSEVAHIDVALVVTTSSANLRVLASNLGADITAQLPAALPSNLLSAGTDRPRELKLDLNGVTRSARIAALTGGNEHVFLVALQPLAAMQQLYSAIFVPLVVGIAILLCLGLIIGLIVWRRFVRPLAALTQLCDYSLNGDYALTVGPSSSRTIAHVGRAFNNLLGLVDTYRPKPGAPNRRSADRK